MKLEVGMYVRTKRGQIGKVITIGKDNVAIEFNRMWQDVILKTNIVKEPSFNIIDLIEVGDYVNGYKVSAIYNLNGDEIVNITLIMEYGYETINTYFDDYFINSIVTKEQFEQMEYKVGEINKWKS